MQIIPDSETSLAPLEGQTIAILGYGNQGRAQALNLRDSGLKVIVGNRDDEYRARAAGDGFEPMEIKAAARDADVMLILTTDESQPQVWTDEIEPGVEAGNLLVWASGYNVGYELITPAADVDVVMVAPRMPGDMVRTLFERGKGTVAQFAVQQDATGDARARALAVSKGIGATRGGVFESSFREEAELDLFAEQVIWAGLTAWIVECFSIGVEKGFSPQLMVMELYASGEASEILGLMGRRGFFRQMALHSTTSQYGTLSRGPTLISDEMRTKARELFQRDIREGAFVDEWNREQAAGSQRLSELTKKALAHPMSVAEKTVIDLLQQSQA